MLVLNYVKMDLPLKEENACVLLVLILSAQEILHFVPGPLVMIMSALVTCILTKELKSVVAVLAQALVWQLTFLTLSVLKVNGMGLFLCCWNLYLFY